MNFMKRNECNKPMNKPPATLTTVIAFILLFGVTAVVIYAIYSFILMLLTTSTNVKVTILSLSGTAVITVLSVLLSKYFEKKDEIRKDQFHDKVQVYQKFITKIIGDILLNNKQTSDNKKQEELEIVFREFVQDMLLWGSGESLHEASKWMTALRTQGSDEQKIYENLFLFEDFLLVIRKDLGHSNRKVQKGDLLRLFIKDFNESFIQHNSEQRP